MADDLRPPEPWHTWPSTTSVSHASVMYERCSVCGVRRFSDDAEQVARAEAACPGPGVNGVAWAPRPEVEPGA